MATSGSILGNAVLRVEDPAILRGAVRYVDDLPVDAALHVAFVRSTVAHARLDGVDAGDAAAMPGVVAVFTGDDLGLAPRLLFGMAPPAMARPFLATERVRYVGDIVAMVLAETKAQAVDAAELVVVDYDFLPAVVDPEAALADGAPLLFEEHGTNVAMTLDFGDDPTVLDDAEIVVRGRFVNQRVAPVPMEPNGVVVQPDSETGGLLVHVTTQGPYSVRDPLADVVGVDPEHVRVVAPAVGGGFGAKMGVYTEHLLVAAAAKRLGRPVRWTETRSENLVAMHHGRAQVHHVELGLRRDGTFTGLRVRVVQDAGAYPAIGSVLPFMTRMMAQGVYRIPKVECNAVSVVTNTTPTGAYRGAGRPEATALLERIVDMAAAELDVDPVELRRRNLLPPDDFPLTTVTGAVYDVGEYGRALDEATQRVGYDELRREQATRRERGDVRQIGVGVSTYVEVTAGAGLHREFGAIEVEHSGRITAKVGTSAHGQGHETSFKMIVSELLGVPMDQVDLVQSDTGRVPRGGGTGGSRSLQIGGSAIYRASEDVLDQARKLAAHLLEAAEADIVVHPGLGVGVAGVPARALSWGELSLAATDPAKRPEGVEGPLAAALDFDQGEATYPFGAHVAVVEVDTETGVVELVRHVAVDDCGRILNPMLVRGQQHGGVAQGAAQALYEQVVYDDDGNPLTGNLMDYAFPSAAELPSFDVANTETPTPLNPLGAKGIGESGTIGATPAVHNAVVDALAPYGVRHLDMPCTAEKVWRAIREGLR